jgi:hypothetical protein
MLGLKVQLMSRKIFLGLETVLWLPLVKSMPCLNALVLTRTTSPAWCD